MVAIILEDLGKSGNTEVEIALVTGLTLVFGSGAHELSHLAQTGNMIVGAGHEHGPRW